MSIFAPAKTSSVAYRWTFVSAYRVENSSWKAEEKVGERGREGGLGGCRTFMKGFSKMTESGREGHRDRTTREIDFRSCGLENPSAAVSINLNMSLPRIVGIKKFQINT